MDIESDDSERWEDFFGSSTELTPSLMGMYDSLTGSLKEVLQKRQRSLPDLNEENTKGAISQNLNNEKDILVSESSSHTESDTEQPAKKFERDTKQTRSNICILSHNVQRLLHHSESLEKIEGPAILKQHKVTFDTKPEFIKKSKPKLSNIPLSEKTTKLTQSVKELVETFDSSTEYLNNLGHKKYPYPRTPVAFDSEKTPTNAANEAFNFEIAKPKRLDPVISPLLHEIEELIEVEKVMELGALYDRDTKSEVADVIEAYNYSVGSNLNGDTSTIPANTTANGNSFLETLPESIEMSPTATRKPSPRTSPLLTYARSKSMATNKTSTPISSHLTKANEKSKTSVESLTDRLTDMKLKFSPKESRKLASLKHRPLSSSSISSTSSSSSSGSEHIKLATSYLASVESLADHSENDQENGRHGTYSVFERACMEFVDTERNYVEDLRQIIQGYLHDWRERACLDPRQLSILFSNIEDIYEFNVKLLKQLLNSGMDPFKIAKCFIDLRDGFDVYTTYCTSYPEATSLLTSLLQEPHTSGLLNTSQKMLHHKLPLGSYLLKPVQRILKYHLLLDSLRKHCDVKDVARAHEIMLEVAANINQVKRKLEQKSRVKELSGILDGWMGPVDLTVLGDLRQEGVLMEHNKPRRVFLFGTMLIITKPKEDGRLQFKTFICQNNLMLNEHLPGEPTSFYVIPYDEPRNQIKLTAKNREHKRFWAQEIKSVMLEKFNNIPSRAKELVYKLGEEEDRTPDTNKWKWSLNNSKPIYLERRNECRRSEMRNRSKIKRKTSVTNSTSFEGFNYTKSVLEHHPLSKNHSMDDNMMSTLPRINLSSKTQQECCVNAPDCDCVSQKPSKINPALSKFNKERSRSVPRMSIVSPEADGDTLSLMENLDSHMAKLSKAVEVKMYNTKTIPKRIAYLKKNRTKKETSTFYMDLHEFEDTASRISESTEDLSEEIEKAEEAIPEENDSNVQKEEEEEGEEKKDEKEVQSPETETTTKEDVQIILDLLKNNKEFDRIYKKPQKKKSLENNSLLNSPEPVVSTDEPYPPRPPSKSPPPLEVEHPAEPSEPIYESLLRNVHVPYKFSPILNRSKSQQYYKPRENKSSPTNRPDSDYVTLVYSASGNLQKIGDDLVKGFSGGPQLRSSDSKINYETIPTKKEICEVRTSSEVPNGNTTQQPEAIYARPVSKNLVKRLLSISKSEHVSGSENSLNARVRKSVESVSLSFGKSNKPPERRVSDVTDMCRQSYLHRMGSEAVGERIANVDYADPRTLFANASINNSVKSLKGDSVFSLTSSNDSVFDFVKKKRELPLTLEYLDKMTATCLETDFRDSAIYSDDTDKRQDYSDITTNGKYHPDSPPPLPPPRKPCGISNPAVILGPAHMSSTASRSWVMKQIENFSRENQQ